jgi:L-threonylcarbamoyladenylate synthase
MQVLDARIESIERVVEAAAAVIFDGGTIVFPNDTSYALGCDPYRPQAVDRVYTLKAHSRHQALTLLVASPAEFLEYARSNPLAILASKRLLPGPVTLIVRKPAFLPDDVTAGLTTLEMRVPDEPVARAILERAGPLAAASIVGNEEFDVDLRIENGTTRYDRESTIVDITEHQARLVREGAVGHERLAELLGSITRTSAKARW